MKQYVVIQITEANNKLAKTIFSKKEVKVLNISDNYKKAYNCMNEAVKSNLEDEPIKLYRETDYVIAVKEDETIYFYITSYNKEEELKCKFMR